MRTNVDPRFISYFVRAEFQSSLKNPRMGPLEFIYLESTVVASIWYVDLRL
jgi:hypothetical protein